MLAEVVMARFYFDIADGTSRTRDDEGLELPDIAAALLEARRAAAGIAHESMLDNRPGPVTVTIRETFTRAPLQFEVRWGAA